MSNCRGPNCNLKNFVSCSTSSHACIIDGPGGQESDPTCSTKSGISGSPKKNDTECVINDLSSLTAQLECESKKGCKWEETSPNIIEKKCKADDAYTCGGTITEEHRYSI